MPVLTLWRSTVTTTTYRLSFLKTQIPAMSGLISSAVSTGTTIYNSPSIFSPLIWELMDHTPIIPGVLSTSTTMNAAPGYNGL